MQRNLAPVEYEASGDNVDRNIAISVISVSKCYQIYDKPQDRLKQAIIPRLHQLRSVFAHRTAPRYFREFWALKDVSFQVKRGESLGIIGRNGAGKSTLLQIVAGTLTPTSGRVELSGRVGALLELGSGFNPEFTGRENIYLNAALLGLSAAQTDAKFAEIIAFADIGDFIEQPVKTYSSGMLMRLAFSVQTAVHPHVLIVDEALAVGDAKFQKKCYDRMRKYQENGGTVLFVTHDTHIITQTCNRALILEAGGIYEMGEPHLIAKSYHRLLFGVGEPTKPMMPSSQEGASALNQPEWVTNEAGAATIDAGERKKPLVSRDVRYGSRKAEIVEVGIRDIHGTETTALELHGEHEFYFKARYNTKIEEPLSFGFSITNRQGTEIYATKGGLHGCFLPPAQIGSIVEARMRLRVPLVPGDYFLSTAVAPLSEDYSEEFFDYWFDALHFRVYGQTRSFTSSMVDLNAKLWAEQVSSTI